MNVVNYEVLSVNKINTFADDVLPLSEVLAWGWDGFVVVVSVVAVEATVVFIGLVMWSAGSDSGTVCKVDLIVVDMVQVNVPTPFWTSCVKQYFDEAPYYFNINI